MFKILNIYTYFKPFQVDKIMEIWFLVIIINS